MAEPIQMIRIGLTMKTGAIQKWLKKEGDSVTKGEDIAEMATEKLTSPIPAPASGILLKILVNENEEVPIGHLLGYIGELGEEIPQDSVSSSVDTEKVEAAAKSVIAKDKAGKKVRISPAARKRAEELGVDYQNLQGTGPGGRITIDDVEQASARGEVRTAEPLNGTAEEYIAIPYAGMRKAIGDNMTFSWQNPSVTIHGRADMFELLKFYEEMNAKQEKENRISITAILVTLCAAALKKNPQINALLMDQEIRQYSHVHLGVAVALEEGLIVPVIKNAETMDLPLLNETLGSLANKARQGKLAPHEFQGATFTLTNLGKFQSVEFFTPIINPPESAILGVGKIIQAPVYKDGGFIPRPMLGLSLSFDHRVIDGAVAAAFLDELMALIASPQAVL